MSVVTPSARSAHLPEPVAARITVPGWRNPKLLIGFLIVLTATAVGARVMALADHTVPVYAARAAMPSGSPLDAGSLIVVRLRLGGTGARYLDATQAVPEGRVLLRPVGAGEVIPAAAVGSATQLRLRPVSIPIDGPPPAGLAAGGLVDIWASAKAPSQSQLNQGQLNQSQQQLGGAYLDAQRIAASAEVSQVESESRALAAGSGAVVQVLLSADALPAVLNALANDARIAVLPIPGAQGASGAKNQPGSQ